MIIEVVKPYILYKIWIICIKEMPNRVPLLSQIKYSSYSLKKTIVCRKFLGKYFFRCTIVNSCTPNRWIYASTCFNHKGPTSRILTSSSRWSLGYWKTCLGVKLMAWYLGMNIGAFVSITLRCNLKYLNYWILRCVMYVFKYYNKL